MKRSSGRSIVAILTSAFAVLMLAATPALAAGGYLEAGRHFELRGDRDYVRVVGQVANPSPGGSFVVQFALGSTDLGGEYIEVELAQEGESRTSRVVKANVGGNFTGATGQNCQQTSDFHAECRRGGYNWVADRDYRLVLNRSAAAGEGGYTWTLKIVDTESGEAQKLVQVTSEQSQLAPNASFAKLQLSVSDCANVDTFAAIVQKPASTDGTTTRWGDPAGGLDGDAECQAVSRTQALTDGVMKMKISN